MMNIIASDRRPPSHLAPRSGEREGPGAQRREGEGHPCYLSGRSVRENIHQHTDNGVELLQGSEFIIAERPLTFPLLRNGPLPLPASRGEVFSAHAGRSNQRRHHS